MVIDIALHVMVDLLVAGGRLLALRCLVGQCDHEKHKWRVNALNVMAIIAAAILTVSIVG